MWLAAGWLGEGLDVECTLLKHLGRPGLSLAGWGRGTGAGVGEGLAGVGLGLAGEVWFSPA